MNENDMDTPVPQAPFGDALPEQPDAAPPARPPSRRTG